MDAVKELLMQTYTIALPVLLGYIVWLLQNQKKDRDANTKGTMLLLRVQLIEYHDRYMKLGSIPSYAYENFCEMYEAYHKLGGNGMTLDELLERRMRNEIHEQKPSHAMFHAPVHMVQGYWYSPREGCPVALYRGEQPVAQEVCSA